MLTHKGSPVIHTQRLILRPYRLGDEAAMYRNWASDPDVTKYLTWDIHASVAVTKAVVEDWVGSYASDTVYHWGITEGGELIGDIAVVKWHEREEWCEIGYCMGKAWWGRGYMTESLRAVLRFLFTEVGFHRAALCHDIDNPASGRVMQKAGMQQEGVMRERAKRRDGSFGDIVWYGALAREWR